MDYKNCNDDLNSFLFDYSVGTLWEVDEAITNRLKATCFLINHIADLSFHRQKKKKKTFSHD
jgi:hypothetical protein